MGPFSSFARGARLRAAQIRHIGAEPKSRNIRYARALAQPTRKKRRMRVLRLVAIMATLALAACAGLSSHVPGGGAETPTFSEIGVASWYGRGHHGKRTANGERFDMNRMTAAHKSI